MPKTKTKRIETLEQIIIDAGRVLERVTVALGSSMTKELREDVKKQIQKYSCIEHTARERKKKASESNADTQSH